MKILDKVNNWEEFWNTNIKGAYIDIPYTTFKRVLIETFNKYFIEFQTPTRLMAHEEVEQFCTIIVIKLMAYVPRPVILLTLMNIWKEGS